MARPRREPAVVVRLSATLTATIHGSGGVLLTRGSTTVFPLNDREARLLAEEIAEYERGRFASRTEPG
jgi:hypothetical protein